MNDIIKSPVKIDVEAKVSEKNINKFLNMVKSPFSHINSFLPNPEVKRIKEISDAIDDTPDNQDVLYKDGELNIQKRAQLRIESEHIKEQENIDNILKYAHEDLLNNSETHTEEPIDDDWFTRFINEAKSFSKDEIQNLWGRILSKEIQKPKSFSLRTLDILRNINYEEAILFEKISNLTVNVKPIGYLFEKSMTKLNLPHTDLLKLENAGLINYPEQSEITFNPTEKGYINIFFKNKKGISLKSQEIIKESVFTLTKAGTELSNIAYSGTETNTIKEIAKELKRKFNFTENIYISYLENDFARFIEDITDE